MPLPTLDRTWIIIQDMLAANDVILDDVWESTVGYRRSKLFETAMTISRLVCIEEPSEETLLEIQALKKKFKGLMDQLEAHNEEMKMRVVRHG